MVLDFGLYLLAGGFLVMVILSVLNFTRYYRTRNKGWFWLGISFTCFALLNGMLVLYHILYDTR